MFDRPEEKKPRNTGRVNNNAENPVSESSSKSYLYIIIGIVAFILLVMGGIFVFNLGKKSSSYSTPKKEVTTSETTDSQSKVEEISFQELVGEYTGTIENKPIKVRIFLEGKRKRYSYSHNNGLDYMLFHFPATNNVNFHRPKEGLAEFRAFKEEGTIVLRSPKVELRKMK